MVLPSLTEFDFLGDGDYLDDFVARIDTPLLEDLHVAIFHDDVIEISHLSEFVLRTGGHTSPNEATLHADEYTIFISFSQSVASSEGNRRRCQLGVSFFSYGPYPSIWRCFVASIYPLSSLQALNGSISVQSLRHLHG